MSESKTAEQFQLVWCLVVVTGTRKIPVQVTTDLTPNIHAHYTDHGQLQFCSIILEDYVEINFGATVMPLTQYREGCCLRPHSVTVKGQICENQEYFGNPCKAVASSASESVATLFCIMFFWRNYSHLRHETCQDTFRSNVSL